MPEQQATEYGRCRICQASIVRHNRKTGGYHARPRTPNHYAIPSVVA